MPIDLSPLISQSTEDQVDEASTDSVKHYAHIVNPPDNPEVRLLLIARGNPDPMPQDIVDVARVNRLAIKAICGYVWVPSRDPENHDVCPICIDVAGMYMREDG